MDALSMAVGFVLGAITVALTAMQAFTLAARYQRTGHVEALVVAEDKNGVPASPEGAAHARVMADAVQKGADEIMRLAEAQGERLTRDEAERDARQLLESVHGSGGMGGVN